MLVDYLRKYVEAVFACFKGCSPVSVQISVQGVITEQGSDGLCWSISKDGQKLSKEGILEGLKEDLSLIEVSDDKRYPVAVSIVFETPSGAQLNYNDYVFYTVECDSEDVVCDKAEDDSNDDFSDEDTDSDDMLVKAMLLVMKKLRQDMELNEAQNCCNDNISRKCKSRICRRVFGF